MKKYLVVFVKGIAMGASDIVPGVSGGTIAFITGIYDQLLGSIRSINLTAIKLLIGFKIKELIDHTNAFFMIALLAGIGTAALSLSKGLQYLLNHHPILIWSFFFGLIVASAYVVGRKIKNRNWAVVVSGLVGAFLAAYITVLNPIKTPDADWFMFFAGAIAICAMILPGISGSFLLVLMGKYDTVLGAISDFKFATLGLFAAGCVTGILAFSHVLHWLLKKYHDITVALLTGFMVGSLNKVWPWKFATQTYTDHHGEVKPLVEQNLWPAQFTEKTGIDNQLLWAALLALAGLALVIVIEKLADNIESK